MALYALICVLVSGCLASDTTVQPNGTVMQAPVFYGVHLPSPSGLRVVPYTGQVPYAAVPKSTKPTPADVASWLGFMPYAASNPGGFQTGGQVTDAAAAMLKPKLGAISSSGHTAAPITITTGAILAGGTTATQSGLVDPVSGLPPGVGSACLFRPAGSNDFPANLVVSCMFTAAGTAAIRAVPLGGLALGSQTLTGNIFWIW